MFIEKFSQMNLLTFIKTKSSLFLFLASTLLLQGCIYKVDRVKIEGYFHGNPKEYIFISKFEGSSLILIDSIKTSSRGFLKLTLNVETPFFVTFGLDKQQSPIILLVQPGEEISLVSNSPNLKDYKVIGSVGSSLLLGFEQRFNLVKSQVDSIKKEYLSNLENPKIDSIQYRLDSLYNEIANNHHEFATNFIKDNAFSLVSILALFQSYDSLHPVFDYSKDRKLFRLIDSSLHSVYSSNRTVIAYHKKLTKLDSLYNLRHKREMMFKEGDILPNVGYPLVNNDYFFYSSIWYKYILIDFWGDWCDVCHENNQELKDIYREYAPKGLVVLQVSVGGIPDSIKSSAARDSITWYQACVPDMYRSRLLDTLKISSIPSSYIADRWGTIKAVNVNGSKLRLKLKELFPEK